MGILEFFGALVKHGVSSSSIQADFKSKLPVNHFFLDFNSIVHVSSQKILAEVNTFYKLLLKTLFHGKPFNHLVIKELFVRFKIPVEVQSKFIQGMKLEDLNQYFHEFFTAEVMDKLIITLVVNTVFKLVRTYCLNNEIKTLMMAIDGVPSKAKMLEQKQRRYLGAIIEEYKSKLLEKYKEYLTGLENYPYVAEKNAVRWSRGKITPGTAFMNKLCGYLKHPKVMSKLKANRPHIKIILTDMYEVGEAEKKIVNYINKYLAGSKDTVMVYSPDADVILLCMLLKLEHVLMLRHNQQTSKSENVYDLINIESLKNNIGYYINNHPDHKKSQFDSEKINNDLVCISTLFGNDFVPKIETLNVKRSFQKILDAYITVLFQSKSKDPYLVRRTPKRLELNFEFLKTILEKLIPEENDYIKNYRLYTTYTKAGLIKNTFEHLDVNEHNVVAIVTEFRKQYENLKHLIKNNGNYRTFSDNDQFMTSLKRCINISNDGQIVNTIYLSNDELVDLLKQFYKKKKDFPRLTINLDVFSTSITDRFHAEKAKELNNYEKEVYQFNNMLDQYKTKLNAIPLDLSSELAIGKYYQRYFRVIPQKDKELTPEGYDLMEEYVEGLIWVFNYYFNDVTYINYWFYPHERSPLLKHILMYIKRIDQKKIDLIQNNLSRYQVAKLQDYFNPVEQLIYVSPLTEGVISTVPVNYRQLLRNIPANSYMSSYFVDIHEIVDELWREYICNEVDCRGMPYLSKCLLERFKRNTREEDQLFLKEIRTVKPTEVSKNRSKMAILPY